MHALDHASRQCAIAINNKYYNTCWCVWMALKVIRGSIAREEKVLIVNVGNVSLMQLLVQEVFIVFS